MSVSSGRSTDASPTLRPLRSLSVELVLVVLAKIVLLALIWWVAFAPQPKPDVSPDAIAHRLAPTSQTPEGHP